MGDMTFEIGCGLHTFLDGDKVKKSKGNLKWKQLSPTE